MMNSAYMTPSLFFLCAGYRMPMPSPAQVENAATMAKEGSDLPDSWKEEKKRRRHHRKHGHKHGHGKHKHGHKHHKEGKHGHHHHHKGGKSKGAKRWGKLKLAGKMVLPFPTRTVRLGRS